MRGTNWGKAAVGMSAMVCGLLAGPGAVSGQSAGEGNGVGAARGASQTLDLATVGSLLKQLQAQVQELNTQVKELKTPATVRSSGVGRSCEGNWTRRNRNWWR